MKVQNEMVIHQKEVHVGPSFRFSKNIRFIYYIVLHANLLTGYKKEEVITMMKMTTSNLSNSLSKANVQVAPGGCCCCCTCCCCCCVSVNVNNGDGNTNNNTNNTSNGGA